jgi:hypothetical protein
MKQNRGGNVRKIKLSYITISSDGDGELWIPVNCKVIGIERVNMPEHFYYKVILIEE